MAQERPGGESNLDKRLIWGGAIAALVGAGFGIGIVVELGALAAGAGIWFRYWKNRGNQAKTA